MLVVMKLFRGHLSVLRFGKEDPSHVRRGGGGGRPVVRCGVVVVVGRFEIGALPGSDGAVDWRSGFVRWRPVAVVIAVVAVIRGGGCGYRRWTVSGGIVHCIHTRPVLLLLLLRRRRQRLRKPHKGQPPIPPLPLQERAVPHRFLQRLDRRRPHGVRSAFVGALPAPEEQCERPEDRAAECQDQGDERLERPQRKGQKEPDDLPNEMKGFLHDLQDGFENVRANVREYILNAMNLVGHKVRVHDSGGE
mmetsp:Transcript_7108/g.15685  ORF Transcript_7108/g.15685 Transcript_7108/m.15685 type:complete len:248 (+) Transcript_7108:932-1675(+)